MSKDIESGIFSAILGYFKKYTTNQFKQVVSISPIKDADVYHYHRPQLERKLEKNSVCTVHHDLNDPDPWHAIFRFLPRYIEAKAVICLNQTQKNILEKQGLSSDKLFVVPHGYHEQYLQPKLKRKYLDLDNKITIGMASRRYGRRVKGEAYFYELAKRLDYDRFDFVLVGQDRSISAIKLRMLGFDVKVYERLPYRMFQSFYEKIDVLLMCSGHEGGPANTPEALATCTPMFSSKVGMPKDVIDDGVNGLFLTLDPEVDAAKINNICIDKPELFSSILENIVESRHLALTWQQSVAGNLSVYKQLFKKDEK